MVEFALLAPVFLLLFFGIVVAGIAIDAQVQLNNAVRDAARAAAVCGDSAYGLGFGNGAIAGKLSFPSPQTDCKDASLTAYMTQVFGNIPGGGKVSSSSFTIYGPLNAAVATPYSLAECHPGYKIEIAVAYSQPIYLPLVGRFFGDNGTSSNRTLKADAQATCEN